MAFCKDFNARTQGFKARIMHARSRAQLAPRLLHGPEAPAAHTCLTHDLSVM
jgi:hypothetical protein